jgi:cell division protein FtsW
MAIQQNTRFFQSALRVDYILFTIVAALLAVGLAMVWSVTFAPNVTQGADNPLKEVQSQLLYAAIGMVALIFFSQIDYRFWGRIAVPMILVTVVVLISLFFMPEVNGARRWLMGGSIQPAEFAKLTIIIYMAKWLSSKGEKLRDVTVGLVPFAVIVGIVTGLIVLQPNLSTAIIVGLCAFAMFFIAGADLIQFAFLMIIGGGSAVAIVLNTPYQLERLRIFLNDPFKLTGKEGYQIIETIIALGSGGVAGRGLGAGFSKYGYVPAPHTDSIFALLGEEMGLIGTWAILALFLALAYRGFHIAARAKDPFGQVLATGLTFWLIFQAFVNIGVVTATIPFTGVPLPFISFGGSALIAALSAVGVLLSISRNHDLKDATNATFNFRGRDGGTRVPRVSRRGRDSETRG